MAERQPYLHDQLGLIAAPLQWWSGTNGDLTAGGMGLAYADINLVGGLQLTVGGETPVLVGLQSDGCTATFTYVIRHLQDEGCDGADPHVTLIRRRRVTHDSVLETLTIESRRTRDLTTVIAVEVTTTATPVDQVKHGRMTPVVASIEEDTAGWGGGGVQGHLIAPHAKVTAAENGELWIARALRIPARGCAVMTIAIEASATPRAAPTVASTAARLPKELAAVDQAPDPRLARWLAQSISDLDNLRLEHRDVPGQPFFGAGAPWYLTLFGRDSLWAARLMRELSPLTATGTVRVLAAFQGKATDPVTEEAPGKILHELRSDTFSLLPTRYYGTIDATPLWVCLLCELWRENQLGPLEYWLPALNSALAWITGAHADPDGDGFLEYVQPERNRGLSNQGWKDSTDAIRFADGTLASGPIALSEVQGYAFLAVTAGVAALRSCGTPEHQDAAERYEAWALALKERFADRFLLASGLPALALDGSKRRVDATSSNMGHLLGTGILAPNQERQIADRLLCFDMSSGMGLRTMSSDAGGYNPFSYHCGSVWAHDTAIAIRGMSEAGLANHARQLALQLLTAAEQFDYRLPELWSGLSDRVVPYPAACRPQAWAAAAVLPAIRAMTAGTTTESDVGAA